MSITLYNTLTRKKEPFTPIDPANVRMYVCGPTVYDFAHIGNARPVIVFDVLFRLLRHEFGADHVKYVRNITDVDDKINDRAARDYPDLPLNEAIRKVTESTAQQFYADVKALGCDEPNEQPRATDNIKEMVEIIQRLLNTDHAYIAAGAQGREVLFAVGSMPAYGALSNRKLDEQIEGARVAVEAHKRNPADFVLWKESAATEPGWSAAFSEAGETVSIYGRPGWHIECSAMSHRYLGETFDIHGGGIDLVFPHHENEIAQSCCAFGTDVMANVWMHNGFLQVEGQKMSKSLGNFFTIFELLKLNAGAVMRFVMLETHYRTPLDWQASSIERAKFTLLNWSERLNDFGVVDHYLIPKPEFIDHRVVELLSDDLNTSSALMRLGELSHLGQTDLNLAKVFASTLGFVGFPQMDKPVFFQSGFIANMFESGPQILPGSEENIQIENFRALTANNYIQQAQTMKLALEKKGIKTSIIPERYLYVGNETSAEFDKRVEKIIASRIEARKAKNFAESDRIRDELVAMRVQLKDGKDADGNLTTEWEVKR